MNNLVLKPPSIYQSLSSYALVQGGGGTSGLVAHFMAGWLESQRGGATASGSLVTGLCWSKHRNCELLWLEGGLILSLHAKRSEMGLRHTLTKQTSHSVQNIASFCWGFCASCVQSSPYTHTQTIGKKINLGECHFPTSYDVDWHNPLSVYNMGKWRRSTALN